MTGAGGIIDGAKPVPSPEPQSPTAVGGDTRRLVCSLDGHALEAHGALPDSPGREALPIPAHPHRGRRVLMLA